MRFLKRRRQSNAATPPPEDPISGVANLFDASVVFIVSMMISLFMAYNMLDMINPNSEMTMVKKGQNGQLEVIVKKGKEVQINRVTDKKLNGEGVRLGTAYQLKDGRVVYVPEN
jgi:hypothetical protein